MENWEVEENTNIDVVEKTLRKKGCLQLALQLNF
jgi:hypothetical protein